jgi:hypothetical protein
MSNPLETELSSAQDPVWRSIRGLRKMLAKTRKDSEIRVDEENKGNSLKVPVSSVSFAWEEENRENSSRKTISPQFNKPLALKENINRNNEVPKKIQEKKENILIMQEENESLMKVRL